MERISQSVAKRVVLKAFLSSDHLTAATGKTIAVVISKNGAAFGNPNAGATNATEIANGWYYVDLDTTDTGTLGPLIVRGTEGTIDATEKTFSVETVDFTATQKSSINAEVLDVLNVDTFAEPGQEAPPATTTLVKKIGYLFKNFRNRKTQTPTQWSLYGDDATTVHQKRTVADDGTGDAGEVGTGA